MASAEIHVEPSVQARMTRSAWNANPVIPKRLPTDEGKPLRLSEPQVEVVAVETGRPLCWCQVRRLGPIVGEGHGKSALVHFVTCQVPVNLDGWRATLVYISFSLLFVVEVVRRTASSPAVEAFVFSLTRRGEFRNIIYKNKKRNIPAFLGRSSSSESVTSESE